MIELETEPDTIVAAKSTRVVRVTGKGVRNPSHPHRVLVLSDGSVVLQAEATVLAARPIANGRDEVAGTVAIGERIEVDGNVYLVAARPLADPRLVADPSAEKTEGQ
jgi:hypothetical protein